MNLSENQGSITLYNGLDSSSFTKLMHLPTKAYNDFYTLEDIQANGMSLQGEHVNLLAAVKKVSTEHTFWKKNVLFCKSYTFYFLKKTLVLL